MRNAVARPDDASAHRALWIAVTALAVYSGAWIIPRWWPGFAGSPLFFLYVLSVPFIAVVLLGLIVWGLIGSALSLRRGLPVSQAQRVLVLVPLAGCLMFGSSIALSRLVRGSLPSGSHLLEFDAETWHDPASSDFVRGDITPRQKMLGSVVEHLTPNLDRGDIAALLGPSLDTPYFASLDRDLIYILGPERDRDLGIDSEWLLICSSGLTNLATSSATRFATTESGAPICTCRSGATGRAPKSASQAHAGDAQEACTRLSARRSAGRRGIGFIARRSSEAVGDDSRASISA